MKKKSPGYLNSSLLLQLAPASTAELSVLVAVSQSVKLWKMKFQLSHDMQTTEFSVSWKSRIIPSSLVRGEEKGLWHHSFKSSQHCSSWVPKLQVLDKKNLPTDWVPVVAHTVDSILRELVRWILVCAKSEF